LTDRTQLWGVDAPLAADPVTVFAVLPVCRRYPDTLGYAREFEAMVRAWRPAEQAAKLISRPFFFRTV
jgi:hypothetical protein